MMVASGVETVKSVASTVAQGYDEILKQYLVKALESTGNLIDKSVDMVMQQAPILVQEVLHWYFAYNLILFVIGVILLSVVAFADYKFIKWENDQISKGHDDGFMYIPFAIINAAVIITILGDLVNLTWLKIWIAPRLWLIEYASSLIKATH